MSKKKKKKKPYKIWLTAVFKERVLSAAMGLFEEQSGSEHVKRHLK